MALRPCILSWLCAIWADAMAWVEYSYYTDVYLGQEIAEEDFSLLEERGERFVDYITGGEAAAQKALDCVKKAVCAVAEVWQKQEKGGAVTAEKIGEWSRTYAQQPDRTVCRALLEAAQIYLAPAGLMRTVGWA